MMQRMIFSSNEVKFGDKSSTLFSHYDYEDVSFLFFYYSTNQDDSILYFLLKFLRFLIEHAFVQVKVFTN